MGVLREGVSPIHTGVVEGSTGIGEGFYVDSSQTVTL